MSSPARVAEKPVLESPVKALFAGEIPEPVVFPYPEIAPEERETVSTFLDSFRDFARDKIDPARIDREHRISDEVVRGLADLGVFGMTIPEEYGGYGFSASAYCRVTEEIGHTDASLAILVGGHQSIGMKGLLLFGTEDQKKKWLPALATGEWIAAFALTEPEAGSDAASIRTTADYDSATDTFLINGSKHWISNGGFAKFFTVFARDVKLDAKDEHRRITAFVLTKDLAGIEPGPEEKKLGLKGSSTVPIQLNNVRVPASHVLGQRGQGFKIAVETLNTGRTALGAGCLGGSKRMIELAIAQATQRKQFATRIADFEMIRGKFARMLMNSYALESMVYMTSGLVDRGLADYSLEGACCKIFGTESAWQTINDALQIAGGNGFMEEYPYERALRDSRVNMIFEGTNEILRVLVSLSGFKEVGEGLKEVGRALKTPVSSFGVLSDYAVRRVRRTLPAGKPTRVAAELSSEGEALARYAVHTSGAVETILRKYGKDVVGKEYHQERLANVAIDLYASLAVISRVTSAIAQRGADKCAEEIRLAKLFVRSARHRIVGNLKDMDRNRDPDMTALSEGAYRAAGYPFPYWA